MAIVIRTSLAGLTEVVASQPKLEAGEFVTYSIAGQKDILFPYGKSYDAGTSSIFVFVDGIIISPTKYQEITPTQIRLNAGLQYNQEICVKWFKLVDESLLQNPVSTPTVVVSTVEPPQSNVTTGTVWFNPDWSGSLQVWNGSLNRYEEVAFKRDIVNAGLATSLNGGDF